MPNFRHSTCELNPWHKRYLSFLSVDSKEDAKLDETLNCAHTQLVCFITGSSSFEKLIH